ncbi:MAG: large-conductance mechanosensitive channel protein MscL [Hyphomonadaceae bacterium]|nr:large-conductance mechanosensitive channel protein MscL [Hyphomonadaceae bacterium]
MLKEFRDFALRGSVVDLAVGIIIGAAFNGIVNSLVSDVIMPPIGWLTGGIDFSSLAITLPATPITPPGAPPVQISYGKFINAVISFLIVAWVIFMLVKGMNQLRKQQAAQPDPVPPGPTPDQVLLTEIRDLLKSRS